MVRFGGGLGRALVAMAAFFTFSMLAHFSSRTLLLVDIEIGTNGYVMDSSAPKLITFDPGDKLLIEDKVERHPFGIADFEGVAKFRMNVDNPACSSLNFRNDIHDQEIRRVRVRDSCGNRNVTLSEKHMTCMTPKVGNEVEIPVRRLSSFMKERGIRRVNNLKVDAQGSDFAILKDVLENAPGIEYQSIMVECQDFAKTVPLYFASNDCGDIADYVKGKFSAASIERRVNNCVASEYNLVLTNLKAS